MHSVLLHLLFLPLAALAQPGPPEPLVSLATKALTLLWSDRAATYFSDADSVAFITFILAYEQAAPQATMPHLDEEYRLVWYEKREGWHNVVVRGDGRTLKDFLSNHPPLIRDYPDAAFYRADRYTVVSYDPPTRVIRYDHWYFERHGPL